MPETTTNPMNSASGPEGVAGLLWQVRWPLLLLASLCALLAAGVSALIPERYQAQVQVAVGSIPPAGVLEVPEELARRFSSPSKMLDLLLEPEADVAEKAWAKDEMEFRGEMTKDTRIVTLTVDASDAPRAEEAVDQIIQKVLHEHDTWFDEVFSYNQQEIAEISRLLTQIESTRARLELERRGARTEVGPLCFEASKDPREKMLPMREYLSRLRARVLRPRSIRSRVVYGPEVGPAPGRLTPVRAAALGFVCALLLGVLWAAVRESSR